MPEGARLLGLRSAVYFPTAVSAALITVAVSAPGAEATAALPRPAALSARPALVTSGGLLRPSRRYRHRGSQRQSFAKGVRHEHSVLPWEQEYGHG